MSALRGPGIHVSPSMELVLSDEFRSAAEQVWKYRYNKAFQSQKMRLYGLYKAATVGKCASPKPRNIMGQDLSRKKWESWMRASTYTKEEAMRLYIEAADVLLNECLEAASTQGGDADKEDAFSEVNRLNERTKKLEGYLQRIQKEMDAADALGNDMRGYLFKWRDTSLSLWDNQKWERLFFVLKDTTLYIYNTDREPTPEGQISLTHCVLQDEGLKLGRRESKSGLQAEYHVFGLYLAHEGKRGPDAAVILRLSSDKKGEAERWMEAIQKATFLEEETEAETDADTVIGTPASSSPPEGRPALPKHLRRQMSRSSKLLVSPPEPPKKRQFDPSGFPASKAMHTSCKPSILSSESPQQNYRGMANLATILLVVNHVRFMWANLLEYGLRLQLPDSPGIGALGDWIWLAGTLLLAIHVLLAYVIESAVSPSFQWVSDRTAIVLQSINVAFEICVPTYIVWYYVNSPVFGFWYLFFAVVLWLKLISYAHYNRDLRLAWREVARGKKEEQASSDTQQGSPLGGPLGYPSNITLADLCYFWAAPTLTYQMGFPRTLRVRKRELLSLVLQLLLYSALLLVVWQQYFYPAMTASVHPMSRGDILETVKCLLQLCIPSTYIWLLMFWILFHVILNILAEVLRFGDRTFYRDWWNSQSVEVFWASWNQPVHLWMVRTVYFPCLRAGFSKSTSKALCFLVSAFFHELVMSVPLHMLRPYAFLGMLANIPLAVVTRQMLVWFGKDSQAGNFVFWLSFCIVGQPASAILYYFDYISAGYLGDK